MEFEQKAEEKKMSMSKNIARLAVTAGLTAALSFGGVMAPVTIAFAAEGATTTTNSITIKQNVKNTDAADSNKKTQFVAYQIFNAKVVDGTSTSDKVVSDVKWADNVTPNTQASIIYAIKQSADYGTSKSQFPVDKTPTAQDVADWMAANLQDASWVVNNGDLLDTIADLVKGATPAVPKGASIAAFDADTSVSFENSGYYLFLTDDGSIGTKDNYSERKQTGTSPIFAVVGGSAVGVTEKTGIPTVTKKIKDDKPGSNWEDKADSQMGQDVQYQLTGTVAENVASFDTYYYEFHDELSAGLTAEDASIRVYAGNNRASVEEITSACTHEVKNGENGAGQTLTVKFTDLKAAVSNLTKDTKIFVEYTAKLDPAKAKKVTVGGEGNENTVKLIYSNNPMSDGRGESVPDTVRDYTYALKLVKQDHDNKEKLQGVGFTIKANDPDDNAEGSTSKGKYVQEHGNLGEEEHEFFTNAQGEITVTGLDAGTYTVHEKTALGEYNSLKDFTFTISTPESGEGSLHQTEELAETVTVTKAAETSNLVILDATQTDGTVNLTVENKKGSNLPLTGLNGVTFTWIAGGAVLCIGVAHLIRSRKQAEESEQE